MSTLDANGKYPEYQKSTMPSTIDNIPKMRNASIADEALISQYVALKQAGKTEEAAAFLAQNEGLEETMWDADKWNTMADAIMATEKTFVDNMAGYTAQVASDMATQISEEYATNNAATISNAIDTQVFNNEDAIPISKGGTGQITAAGIRNILGLGNTTDPLPIENGGTGVTTAAALRNILGLGNTIGAVPIANGGTGATTVASARNNLGLGNTDGALPIANGGTGATSVAGARQALGLGNTSGAVPVANGGTGATTAQQARTNLGLGTAATYAATSNVENANYLVTSGAVYKALAGKSSTNHTHTNMATGVSSAVKIACGSFTIKANVSGSLGSFTIPIVNTGLTTIYSVVCIPVTGVPEKMSFGIERVTGGNFTASFDRDTFVDTAFYWIAIGV